jgi:hypothetical protein
MILKFLRPADPGVAMVITAKVTFVAVSLLIMALAFYLFGAVAAFVVFMVDLYLYGRLRPFLIPPPTLAEYQAFLGIYCQPEWIRPAEEGIEFNPKNPKKMKKNYGRLMMGIDDRAQLAITSGVAGTEVNEWRKSLYDFLAKDPKYAEILRHVNAVARTKKEK